jgi:hypothetical protein
MIAHLLCKDLRHVRILFLLWMGLLVAQASLIGFGMTAKPDQYLWQIVYGLLALGLPMLQAVMLFVLIPLLIQDDPLVGTSAFWLTRPIGRVRLLLAKGIFLLGLLLVPPLVIEVLVLAANGIPWGAIAGVLPGVLVFQLSFLLALSAFAVLTPNFARFALWVVVVWVVAVVAGFVHQIADIFLHPEEFLLAARSQTLQASQSMVSSALAIFGCGFVVAHQYLTRRTPLSVGFLVVALLVSGVAGAVWKVDFLAGPETPVTPGDFPPESVQTSLAGSGIFATDALDFFSNREPRTTVSGSVLFESVPPGYELSVHSVDASVSYPDGETLCTVGSEWPSFDVSTPWPQALSHALGGARIVNAAETSGTAPVALFTIPTAKFEQYKDQPGTLSAKLELEAKQVRVAGLVPLVKGSMIQSGDSRIEIGSVLRQTTGCRIILRERKLNRWGAGPSGTGMGVSNRASYLLFNPERNEAVLAEDRPDMDLASILMTGSSRLTNRSFPVDFAGLLDGNPKVEIDDQWLNGALLGKIEMCPAGLLLRSLEAGNFLMKRPTHCQPEPVPFPPDAIPDPPVE